MDHVHRREREVVMNKVVLAFAVTALVGAAISPLDAREFKHSGCAKAAEIKFPTDRIARKEFKHWCKDQWKILQSFSYPRGKRKAASSP